MIAPLAYYRCDDTQWKLTRERETIIDTPLANLIFPNGETRVDVEVAFEQRFPASREGTSHIRMGHGSPAPHDVVVDPTAVYTGKYVAEACRLAKQDGPLLVLDKCYFQRNYHCSAVPEDFDCVLRNPASGIYAELVYEEGRSDRLERARLRREARGDTDVAFIQVYEFSRVSTALANEINSDVPLAEDLSGWESRPQRPSSLRRMFKLIKIYQIVYGKDSHRAVHELDAFLKRWRTAGAATRKNFQARNGGGFDHYLDWLDAESRKRKPRRKPKLQVPKAHMRGLPTR